MQQPDPERRESRPLAYTAIACSLLGFALHICDLKGLSADGLRQTADSAALAAAGFLAQGESDPTILLVAARAYADPQSKRDAEIAREDVAVGNWDPMNERFEPGAAPFNAARVTVRDTQGNAVSTTAVAGGRLGACVVDEAADQPK
jgi:hypothetical protein